MELYVFRLKGAYAARAICIGSLFLAATPLLFNLPSSLAWTNDQFSFTLLSQAGSALEIQASTNLLSWTTQATETNLTVQCGHEPLAVPRRTESADKSDAVQTLRASGRVSGPRVSVWSECVFSAAFPRQAAIRSPGSLMESPFRDLRMHWDHEPTP